MATALSQLPPLPTPGEPIANTSTGKINSNWYQYLKRLDDHVREIEKRLAAGGL